MRPLGSGTKLASANAFRDERGLNTSIAMQDLQPQEMTGFEALLQGAQPMPTGNCPRCGEGTLRILAGDGVDPDTGYNDGDFAKCGFCGECFDLDDLDNGRW